MSEWYDVKSTRLAIIGLEDEERGLWAKENGSLLAAGKVKERDSFI